MLFWFISRNARSEFIAETGGVEKYTKIIENGGTAELFGYMRSCEWDWATGCGAKCRRTWKAVIHNLNYYWRAIVNDLRGMGYADKTQKILTKQQKEIEKKEFSYIVDGSGRCYGINIKANKNDIIMAVNGDILTGDTGAASCRDMFKLTREIISIAGVDGPTLANISLKSLKNSLHAYNVKGVFRHCDKFELQTGETEDEYIRAAYKGGLNVLRKPGAVEDGVILDVNSLYPYILRNCELPTGAPEYGKGAPDEEILYSGLYCGFMRATTTLELKPGKVPFVKPKNPRDKLLLCNSGNVITNTNYYYKGKFNPLRITLTATFEEWELIKENYETDIQPVDYIYYKTARGQFSHWIDEINEWKTKSAGHRRTAAKGLLNSAIGGMAKRRDRVSIYEEKQENGEYKDIEISTPCASPSHIYIAAYVLSLALVKIVSDIQKNFDRFIYTDTDSIHLKGAEIPGNLKIGGGLGEYKIEHETQGAYYWARKNYAYIDRKTGDWRGVCAGLPIEGRLKLEAALNGKAEGFQHNFDASDRWIDLEEDEIAERDISELFPEDTQENMEARKKKPPELDWYKNKIPVTIQMQSDTWERRLTPIIWEFDPMINYKNPVYKLV